ncbi:receptor-type tyrosine-protein phosphatase eta isoform X2 [Papio anubis]|uniref:receptor-type tyrosine-protein phosphatase eta isoform X2 n=1 Tax=Papio anubis TaxID=9555 RepID=UPI0012AE6242|nr:receptor-type tyrosine-protein phosphatase eta isoform X2 [Papio anubis]
MILCAGDPPGPTHDPSVTTVATAESGVTQISSEAASFYKLNGTGTPQVPTNTSEGGEDSGANDSLRTPEQGSNGTDGASQKTPSATGPSPVFDIKAVSISPTNVILTWKSNDSAASEYKCVVKNEMENETTVTVVYRPWCNITGLRPGTSYVFSITPGTGNETWGDPRVINVVTEPIPVSGLRVALTGVRQATLSWSNGDGTASCRVLLEGIGSHEESTQDFAVNISGLKPGVQYSINPYLLQSNRTEGDPLGTEGVLDASNTERSRAGSPTTPVHNESLLGPADSSSSQQSRDTEVLLVELKPGTRYNATVYSQAVNGTEGQPQTIEFRTTPGPVSDFRVTVVSTTEIGLAWSSHDAESFQIHIMCISCVREVAWGEITTNQSIIIGNLFPGTKYCFEIVPEGPNGTEGASRTVCNRTAPSAVFDIHVAYVTTTEMRLEWKSPGNASEYVYHLVIESKHGSNHTNTSDNVVTLQGLIPGTLYNITISPEVDHVPGDPSSTTQYTRPSNVSNIDVSTSTTAATLSWQNFDDASPTYSYCLLIEKVGNSSNATQVVTGIGITNATVTELIPGSSYTVEIFTQVGDRIKSLEPGWKSFCTDPASVASFDCEVVPKEPALVLKWACPPGANAGFELEVSSGAWDNATRLESCSSENGTEYRTEVTYLNFSTSYNISITTVSCGKMAAPTQSTCTTGITDPPPPDGSPNITSVSHNSVKVKFSGFEASHGPIKAYAVILTTGEAGHPSADVLKYTYEDFKKGASDTYVTYLIRTEEKGHSQSLSEVLKYEIDVGNESTTLGYYNGKLEPLGSYRACVAGFTNITFHPQNHGLIDGAESYVSFSRYSDAVSLPQDPGVICGAVFGCIFGALVIVTVGGFIFWRKKRKDAKNNEVSFSQIKPKKSKLIRVENFEAYFKKQQADSNCGFAEEYEDLKLVGISQPKYAAELAENRGKNRYNNVLPYDISRVKLSVQTHSTDDYINANYMPGYHSKKDFIATQGPLPNTLKDFWRMVWEKNVYAIIMLTKCVEQGRTKCEEYWPSKQAQDYGDITVAMTSEIVLPEWTIRDFTVKNIQTSESHPLRQFHFTSWPDHGVPDTTDLLINFRYLVRDYMKQSPPESPILVHCSAGVGRTGTFIAIDRLIYQIENENTVDVYGIVYDLRMHRPLMVQTEDQYVFLNQCVLDIVRSQKDSKVDLIYQNTTAMTIYENLAPVTTFGKTNGYIA